MNLVKFLSNRIEPIAIPKAERRQELEVVRLRAGKVAHDFNNVLTVIWDDEELQQESLAENHQVSDCRPSMLFTGERGVTREQQALEFGFGSKDRTRVQVVDLSAAVSDSLPSVAGANQGDVIVLQRIRGVLRVAVNPDQLFQIIMNLCANAREAMPTGGILTIGTRRQYAKAQRGIAGGRYAVLEVSDTGFGTPPEPEARVSEPFRPRRKDGRGTGLNLAIVHEIVKSCGGYMLADSVIGAGTTLKVFFPENAADGVQAIYAEG
jgi:signal transduction histidine kinase